MTASLIHTDFIRQDRVQAAVTVLGLSAVALIFLPFIDGEVPVEHFLDGLDDLVMLALLGPCVVLPFAISAGYLRWLLTGGLSRWESAVGYALAMIVVVLFSFLALQALWESALHLRDLPFPASLALGLGAGTWFVIQNLRHETPPTLTALVTMQLAYLPFALGWLTAIGPFGAPIAGDYWADVDIGGWLAVLAVLVYTAQAVLLVRRQPRWWLRVLPIGLVWAGGLVAGLTIH